MLRLQVNLQKAEIWSTFRLEDPVVQERAENRILDRHYADLTTRHIQWRILFA